MITAKRYVEIEIEVEVDEDGFMTDQGHQDAYRLDNLYTACGDLVTHVSMPYTESRRKR